MGPAVSINPYRQCAGYSMGPCLVETCRTKNLKAETRPRPCCGGLAAGEAKTETEAEATLQPRQRQVESRSLPMALKLETFILQTERRHSLPASYWRWSVLRS